MNLIHYTLNAFIQGVDRPWADVLIQLDSMYIFFCVDLIEQTFEAEMNSNWDDVIYVTIFDVTFFILVTTVGLNIIFGIIVDTFSQLRDAKVMYPSSLRFIDPLKRGTTLTEINYCSQQAISVKFSLFGYCVHFF